MCQSCYDHESDSPSFHWPVAMAIAAIAVGGLLFGLAVRGNNEPRPAPSLAAQASHWTVKQVSAVRKLPVIRAAFRHRA